MHDAVFEVLADPTRRRLIDVLRTGERAVNDLVEAVAIHQSGVSRHLGILASAGFVQVRAEGAQRLYSLRPEPFHELDAWLTQYRTVWNKRLDRLGHAIDQRSNARKNTKK